jgi:hypothetical protein
MLILGVHIVFLDTSVMLSVDIITEAEISKFWNHL